MRILTLLNILILAFAGCTRVKYQQIQSERDRLRHAYEDARRKIDRRSFKNALERKVLGTWQFLGIEVLESDLSNEIQTAAVALAALEREHLTIRFFEQNNIRFYNLKNGSDSTSGEFIVRVGKVAEELIPTLHLSHDSGIAPGEALFSRSRLGRALVSVQDDRLYLTVGYGQLLTPNGWAQVGGSRYSFKRIK